MGVGFGTIAGVGGAVGGIVGSAVNNAINSANEQPAQTNDTDDMAAFKAKIDKLSLMKESGIISDEEFNDMKKQLLSSIL